MSNLKHPLVLWLIFKKQYSAESASALQKYTFTQIFFFSILSIYNHRLSVTY